MKLDYETNPFSIAFEDNYQVAGLGHSMAQH